MEVWLPVLGYEGSYEASNLGKIRNKAGKILVPVVTTYGYTIVSLCQDGTVVTARVHQVVLSAFCGPKPFPEAHAAHNNGVRDDNRLVNLRWATPAENQADRTRHKTDIRGVDVHSAVLNDEKVREIRRRVATGERYKSIANDFGVSISTVSLIKVGRIWRHVE